MSASQNAEESKPAEEKPQEQSKQERSPREPEATDKPTKKKSEAPPKSKTSTAGKGKIVVKNKLRQPLHLNLPKGMVHLGPRATLELTKKEFESPAVQQFVKDRVLLIIKR